MTTELELQLVEQSFESIKVQEELFAAKFYDNLFIANPSLQPLFEDTDVTEQGKVLHKTLVLIIENLRKPNILDGSLRGLGARHVEYGVQPEHYPIVGNALLKTFAQVLNDKYTPEVQQAWVNSYGDIVELMLEGAEYSQKEVQLDPTFSKVNDSDSTERLF